MITKEQIISKLNENNFNQKDIEISIMIKEDKNFVLIEQNSLESFNLKKLEKIIKENFDAEVVITSNKQKTLYKSKDIKKIIPVMSCKGGVGKSTITAALAKGFSKNFSIGLLDADIYGPSAPLLFDVNDKKIEAKEGILQPIIIDNLKLMSMGNMLDQDKAAIWRGPMASKALYQLLLSSNWGMLDCLFIDTPPGTGDINLSLLEKFEIEGVILVTTPSILSMSELEKSIYMLKKMNVDVLGIIENMSYFVNSHGEEEFIFGKSDIESFAVHHGIHNIVKLPIGKINFNDLLLGLNLKL